MASTGAHKRSKFVAFAASVLMVAGVCSCPLSAAASNAGGTQAGGTSTAKSSGSTATKASGSTTTTKTKAPSPHVLSVRIESVSCTPTVHCSGNPHQVSTHGTLMLSGLGLKPGMVVGFPKSPGAHIS
ncbi:MAG: hypothetical protein ABR992_08925, partial [Solirubrobacteraceae bacterium]